MRRSPQAATRGRTWLIGGLLAVVMGIAGQGEEFGGGTARALAPNGTSEVNQVPAAGTPTPIGARITYTVTVTLRGPQAANQPLTVQLAVSSNITNRTLSCPNSQATASSANPACMWAPSVAGPYKMVVSGDFNGLISKAVPDGASVMCSDTNSSISCDDKLASDKLPLVDTNGDVGTLPISRAPIATSEVNQTPPGGSTAPGGTHLTYVATVTLLMSQTAPLGIQLRGDQNIDNRAYGCDSSTNIGRTQVYDSGPNPSCVWSGPVPAGTYTFTFSGTLVGIIGAAVPDPASVVCSISGASGGVLGCDGQSAIFKVALSDKDGDVGVVQNGPAAPPPSKPPGDPTTPGDPRPPGQFKVYGIQVSRDN